MLRRLPLLTAAAGCAALLAAAPASAATTVLPPTLATPSVTVLGSPGNDSVLLRADGNGYRISDPSGISLGPGPACVVQNATEALCDQDTSIVVRLGSGDDRLETVDGWTAASGTNLLGEGGNDRFDIGASPRASVDGGSGDDTVSYTALDDVDGLTIDLAANWVSVGANVAGVENAEGTPGDDRILGDGRRNTLAGGEGEDSITGAGGGDLLIGGDGDDELWAIDGTGDTLQCGAGDDFAQMETLDVFDACERRQGPGISTTPPMSAPPITTRPPTTSMPRIPFPRPTVSRPRGRRGLLSIRSRPAADAGHTRVGARVATPYAATLRMTIRHGNRVVGTSDRAAQGGEEATISVGLDAGVRQAVAASRHVELGVLLELVVGDSVAVAEEHQATLVSPPAFVRGAAGVKRVGGFGVQRLRGTPRGDRLSGQSGDDVLSGLGGNDELEGGTGNDRLLGAAGNDRLDGYDGDDRLLGGPGDDLLIESRFGDDTLDGGPGDDWVVGGRGTDHIAGGAGDDVIFGGSGPDVIDCGAGDDTVFVNLESERRTVRSCEKILDEDDIPSVPCNEGEGTDDGETLLGTGGADICKGHGGADDVEGAGGSDRLFGGAGDDRAFGRFGNDQLFGEDGDDELEGGRGEDRLDGGAGADQLNGGYGRDRLDAGPGNDTLISRGGGSDQLDCGPGRDVAVIDRTDRTSGCESIRYR